MTHEWYGPCDGFGPNEECAECKAIALGGYTPEWEAWLQGHKPMTPKQRIEQLEADTTAAIAALAQRLDKLEADTAKAVEAQRAYRHKIADEQRYCVGRAYKLMGAKLDTFLRRSFWQRLNWLLTWR